MKPLPRPHYKKPPCERSIRHRNLWIRHDRKERFCIGWLNVAQVQTVCGEGGKVSKCCIDGHRKLPSSVQRDHPHPSYHTKNTSDQVIPSVTTALATESKVIREASDSTRMWADLVCAATMK